MAEQNSISTLLPELLRMFNNSVESFQKVNQAITSNRESVTVDVQNTDGTISKVTIPSFGYLKNSIDRLEKNIETITNVTGGDSSVRLADGTFRKLVLANLPSEAKDLTSINSVNTFGIKPNWFFEELINPLLYVSFNITGQAPITTESAIVRRYILDLSTQSALNYFNSTYKGKSDISYDDFQRYIVEKNVNYVLDEEVVNLPPRTKRYSGNFSVLRISNIDVTEEINGVSITTQKKLYKLNKLTYTDTLSDFPDTLQLKVGDSIEVVGNVIDTRYLIKQIDTSTNSVVLDLVEGSTAVGIGADVLKIGSNLNNNLSVDVTVGFDEYCVVFIKPIDPNSEIPAINWSPGSAFYTNNLTTVNEQGTQQTLAEFYQDSAIDFGKFLLSFAQDKFPSSREGIIPNAPIIESNDFKVLLVNRQVTNADAIVQLQDLNTQKNTLDAKIKELDQAISQKRTRIQTTNYTTGVDRDADRNELQGLINDRATQSQLYASIVNEIAAKGKDNAVQSILPKYRARGFWKMPEEKVSPATGVQSIIKFIIRYRYLSTDGAANPVEQITFKDGIGTSQGAFSNWEQYESVLRKRVKNSLTGSYEWAPITNDNADSIDINQLDIAIRKGEIAEVQIKSVSEAGWPSNPLESDWSDPVRIEFPADLSSDSVVDTILQQNRQDLAKVNLEADFEAKGINQHLSSSFIANEKYFAHTATAIASGFLSTEQSPIDLFTKLTEMQNRLDQFAEILNRAQGELTVSIVDDIGNVTAITRNVATKIFAGFYSQEVLNLDDPRGAIISKTFFINISNAAQTPLQLISRVTGARSRMVKQSENPAFTSSEAAGGSVILPATYFWLNNSSSNQSDGRPTYISNDTDYNTVRKYDVTPIVLTNPNVTAATKYGQIKSLSPYQSAQCKNQFIYSRYNDVSSEETFYSYLNPENNYIINLDTAESFYSRGNASTTIISGDFIWGGGFDSLGNPTTASSYSGNNDDIIDVHLSHPWVSSYAAFKAAYEYATGDTTTLPATTAIPTGIDCTSSGNGTAAVLFRHSKFAPLTSDARNGKQQCIYLNEKIADFGNLFATGNYPSTLNSSTNIAQPFHASPSLVAIPALTTADYSRNVKSSFDTFDQYVLGKKSCGSYLFMSSDDHTTIQVSGDSIQSTKTVLFGSSNSISIPIVFQYRMTDYYGVGTGSSGGLGNIGGDTTGATTNLTYTKRIGMDIFVSTNDVFQFDLEIFAKYKSDNLNIDIFPSATVAQSLGDLGQLVTQLNPTINQTGGSSGGGGCFVEGTMISLIDGTLKPIEDVQPNDRVVTYNTDDNIFEEGIVERLITPVTDSLVIITLADGSSVTSTPEHPYYVNGKGWSSYDPISTEYLHDINVNHLEINDELMTKDGTYLIITDITVQDVSNVQVYNFEVTGNHCYFANNVLVHNKIARTSSIADDNNFGSY